MQRLSNLLNIQPGEGKLVGWMLFFNFCFGITDIFVYSAAYSLFLAQFDAKSIPYIYLIVSVVTTVISLLYLKLASYISFSGLLMTNLSFVFLMTGLFRLGLLNSETNWVIFLLPVWYNVMWALMNLAFWGLAGRLFDVRQGKRLFGLLTGGKKIGEFTSGFLTPFVVVLVNGTNLLIVAMGTIFFIFLSLVVLANNYSGKINVASTGSSHQSKPKKISLLQLVKSKYIAILFIQIVLGWTAFFFLDVVFLDVVTTRFSNADQLAGFLGVFYAVVAIFIVFGSLFLTGPVLNRFGVRAGILVLPVALTIFLGSLVIGGVLSADITVLFVIIAITRFTSSSFVNVTDVPATNILYQPMSPHKRSQVQATSDGIVYPVSMGVAGILLLFFTQMLSLEILPLSIILLLIVILWIFTATLLGKEYPNMLEKALSKRILSEDTLSLNDSSSITILREMLKSPNSAEVLYALNTLETAQSESLDRILIELLPHPESKIRENALHLIAKHHFVSAIDAIADRIKTETEPNVQKFLIKTYMSLGGADFIQQISRYLKDSNPHIQSGAMIGLLQSGGIQGVLSAGTEILTKVSSQDPSERKLAAEVLGEVGIQDFYHPLAELLKDEDHDVLRAAIISSGKLKNPKLCPQMTKFLGVPELRRVTQQALAQNGEDVIPTLESEFDLENQSSDIRIRIAAICGNIQGDKAISFLHRKIDFPEEDVRHHILKALQKCGYHADKKDIPSLHEMIRSEIDDAAWAIASIVDIGDDLSGQILRDALQHEVDQNYERIFLLLSFLYDKSTILQTQKNLSSNNGEKQAYALELLDNLLPQEIKQIVFPVIENIPPAQSLKRLNAKFPQETLGRNGRLKEIMLRSEEWTTAWAKSCALYIAGQVADIEFYDGIVPCLASSSALVRENAVWALGRLDTNDLVKHLTPLTQDSSRRVAQLAKFVLDSVAMTGVIVRTRYIKKASEHEIALFSNILKNQKENRTRRCRAAQFLSFSKSKAARTALLDGLEIQDETIRSSVLHALRRGVYSIDSFRQKLLVNLINDELEDVELTLAALKCLFREKPDSILIDALSQEIYHNRERLLLIIDLLCHKDIYQRMDYWYLSHPSKPTPDTIANGLKMTVNRLIGENQEVREKILFTIQIPSMKTLTQSWKWTLKEFSTLETMLEELILGSSSWVRAWTRVCALRDVENIRLKSLVPKIIPLFKDVDSYVRETAIWVTYQLEPSTSQKFLEELQNDPSPRVRAIAKEYLMDSETVISSNTLEPPLLKA